MARCSWAIVATNVGPGGQPEDVFEDILEEGFDQRLVATQMSEDTPTGNSRLRFGRSPFFCLAEGGVCGCVVSFFMIVVQKIICCKIGAGVAFEKNKV